MITITIFQSHVVALIKNQNKGISQEQAADIAHDMSQRAVNVPGLHIDMYGTAIVMPSKEFSHKIANVLYAITDEYPTMPEDNKMVIKWYAGLFNNVK